MKKQMTMNKYQQVIPLNICLFCLSFGIIQAQTNSKLDGWVVLQNSKWRTGKVEYIANAQVKATMATPTLSDSKGWFSLLFANIPNGRKVKLSIAKSQMRIVNEKVIEEASFTGHAEELKIVMCNAEDFDLCVEKYYNVSRTELQKTYDRRVAVLNRNSDADKRRLLDSMRSEMNREVKTREEAMALLEEQRKNLEEKAWTFANSFATVNLDDESDTYQQAFKAFTEGDIQRTIDILNAVDLEKRLNENNRQIAVRDATMKDLSAKNDTSRRQIAQDVRSALLLANSYQLKYQHRETQHWFEVALRNDSMNMTILNDYTQYLYELAEFPKATIYNDMALKRVQLLRQNPDSSLYTEGYAMALYHRALLLSRKATEPLEIQATCHKALPLFEQLAQTDTLKGLMRGRLMSELAQAYGWEATNRGDSLSVVWYKNALSIYEQPVSLRMQNNLLFYQSIAYLGLGNTFRYMKKLDDSENECQKAIALRLKLFQQDSFRYAPYLGLAYTMLATTLNINNKSDNAIKALEKSIRYSSVSMLNNPEYSFREIIRAKIEWSISLNAKKQFESADNMLDSAWVKIETIRNHYTAEWLEPLIEEVAIKKRALIIEYIKIDKLSNAENRANKLCKLSINNPEILAIYAIVLIINSKYEKGLETLELIKEDKNYEIRAALKYFEKKGISHPGFIRLRNQFGI
jgi:hypothetical protein